MNTITIDQAALARLLEDAAERGADRALEKRLIGAVLNKKEAAQALNFSFPTLQKHIKNGEIVPAKDGRISHEEIMRFKRAVPFSRQAFLAKG